MRWILRLLPALALGLAAASGLVACSGDEEESSPVSCDELPVYTSGGDECFGTSEREMWCLTEEVRGYLARGRIELADLPEWAVTRERNGSPIIYDIRAKEIPFVSTGNAIGELRAWAERQRLPIELSQIRTCAVSTEPSEVREAEGGGPDTTTWNFDEPVTCTGEGYLSTECPEPTSPGSSTTNSAP